MLRAVIGHYVRQSDARRLSRRARLPYRAYCPASQVDPPDAADNGVADPQAVDELIAAVAGIKTVHGPRFAHAWLRQQFATRKINYRPLLDDQSTVLRVLYDALDADPPVELPKTSELAEQIQHAQQRQRGHGGRKDLVLAVAGAVSAAADQMETQDAA